MKKWVAGLILSISATLASAADCADTVGELVHVHASQNNGAYSLAADQKLMLFYKAPLQAESFQATLNGEDISGRFSPGESRFGEVLALELKQGENVLELSGVPQGGNCTEPTGQRIRLLNEIISGAHEDQVVSIVNH